MKKGDFVKINYVGRLESGEIFDLTYEDVAKKESIFNPNAEYKPITVIVGAGFTIKGLDKALLDMGVNDKKTVEVLPEDGFGERDPKLIKIIPKKHFENPQQGMVVEINGMKGRIQSVSAGRVRVDFNNPLAGKKLIYDVEISKKIDDDHEKVKGVLEFFGAKKIEVSFEDSSVIVKNAVLPRPVKEHVAKLIIDNIRIDGSKNIEKVRFVEEFTK
jgi:FKBP-type peptidyl-prolyl cis-trans isomerase 2